MTKPTSGESKRPEKKKKPVASFEFPVQGGRLQIAVWENTHGSGSEEKITHNVTFKRSYYDSSKNQWGETSSLRLTDLPAMATALNLVYGEIVLKSEQA